METHNFSTGNPLQEKNAAAAIAARAPHRGEQLELWLERVAEKYDRVVGKSDPLPVEKPGRVATTATQTLLDLDRVRQTCEDPALSRFYDHLAEDLKAVLWRSPQSPEHPIEKFQTGTLYPQTKQERTKSGNKTYPIVDGERDCSMPAYRRKPEHWYWTFLFERKERSRKTKQEEWKQKSIYVPRKKVRAVRSAIDSGWPYWRTAKEILGKEV